MYVIPPKIRFEVPQNFWASMGQAEHNLDQNSCWGIVLDHILHYEDKNNIKTPIQTCNNWEISIQQSTDYINKTAMLSEPANRKSTEVLYDYVEQNQERDSSNLSLKRVLVPLI